MTRADRQRSPYLQLPFDVPPGTTRIEVRYRYDPPSILDLGLLDPRAGAFPSRRGFRGWSGGAREGFSLARDAATPGYLAGEIPPGRWWVLLGLAFVADEPCAYRVEIRLDDAPRPLFAPPSAPRAPTPLGGPGWYRGDLQSHTHHSDARGSLDDLARAARERGLDYLAVTDHNTVSHHAGLAAMSSTELLLVPGQEITTYRGHANVWGADDWIDFRVERDADMARVVEEAHRRGGRFSVNHPKRQPGCIGCDWEYPVPVNADAFEAWQGPWAYRNWEALERYDALLRAGRRLALVGGSDRHQPGWPDPDPDWLQVGSPTTWLRLDELSVAGVLAAIGGGRACVSEGPAGPKLAISLGDAAGEVPMGSVYRIESAEPVTLAATVQGADGDLLRWVGEAGTLRETRIPGEDFEERWGWRPAGAFVRAEVVAGDRERTLEVLEGLERLGRPPAWFDRDEALAHDRVRALSNPVYIRAPSTYGPRLHTGPVYLTDSST